MSQGVVGKFSQLMTEDEWTRLADALDAVDREAPAAAQPAHEVVADRILEDLTPVEEEIGLAMRWVPEEGEDFDSKRADAALLTIQNIVDRHLSEMSDDSKADVVEYIQFHLAEIDGMEYISWNLAEVILEEMTKNDNKEQEK
jgi:hypothetical protein